MVLLATLVFFLLRLAPGGPFDEERAFPPEVKANIERAYGLDQPLYRQYLSWLEGALHGDLKDSFQYLGRPVSEVIEEGLPVSVTLGAWALALSLAIGIPLGCLAAWRKDTFWDATSMFISVAGVSLPSYLVASGLILFFSLKLGWFPPALWDGPWSASAVLPVVTLAIRPLSMIVRLTRSSMLEALQSDYVRTARAKGLSRSSILFKHALGNSLIPILSIVGPLAAGLVTGSFVVELVFQLPGIGRHFVQAVLNRDYPLVMGVTLVYGVLLLTCNLAVDLLYSFVDPRIRVMEQELR
jgi:oligopeptide transport system permease protein